MLLSLFLFLMSYVCMLFVWMLFELIFCGVALKNTCRVQDSIIPKHIIFPLIFNIDLFLFAMTWVYISGCIHKHLIQYNFCFAPLIIYFYKWSKTCCFKRFSRHSAAHTINIFTVIFKPLHCTVGQGGMIRKIFMFSLWALNTLWYI